MSEFGSIDDYIRQLTGITTYDVKDAAKMDGISDMHCMSDVYLADELEHEYADKGMGNRR